MFKIFHKIFGLYPGEGLQAFRFACLSLLWAFGSTCLDTLSDGLFLEKIGAPSLPFAFLIISLGMMGISTIVLYCLKITNPYRILNVAMALGVILCLSSALFVGTGPPAWFYYSIKIASRIFFSVMIACSWTFIDQYHDLQDAKRVYAIYSSSYFLGAIFSGFAINFFLDSFGFSTLLIAAAIAIALAMWQARHIARKVKAVYDDTVEGAFSVSKGSLSSIIQLILRSRFTIGLLLLSLFTQIMWTTTEFNYMESLGRLGNDLHGENQIAEFLGKCRAIISFCNILVGIFLYNRIVSRAGLQNVVLITPLFYFGLYSFWVWHDSMAMAVLGLIAVDGILFTVEDNCFNLLSNAVPSKLKSRVRIINDSFFEPVGMLLSAGLLFCVNTKFLGFGLTILALVITLIIRSIYSPTILQNLKDNALHFERKLRVWLQGMTKREQKDAKKAILEQLHAPEEDLQVFAIESLLQLEEELPQILETAKRLSTMAKIHFLRLIEVSQFNEHPAVLELISHWTDENESSELSKWAHLYLAKRGLHHPDHVVEDDPDLFLKAAALLTMKKSLAVQAPETAALNRTIAEKKIELMLKSQSIDEISMALSILAEENQWDAAVKALAFLSHESILVKRSAAKCVAKLANKQFARYAPRLIEELEAARDNVFRLMLLEALGKIADSTMVKDILLASVHFRPNERRKTEEIVIQMGLKIVPLLLTLTKDIALPERARILAGKILSRLALPQLQANLMDILDIEIERAYFYFYFGHTIQKQHPLFDLEMLQSALLTGYQSVIDFIIHLLGAAGSLEDPELLVRALHSRNEKIHSNAIESLEKTCDPRLFRLIAPLVDDLPLSEKMDACLRWQGDYPKLTLSELLGKLEQSPSLFDKIVAIQLKAKLKMPNWKGQLREQMKHSDETFHQLAYELLEI